MARDRKDLLLYEALELRSEFDAAVETLRKCLPESRAASRTSYFDRGDAAAHRPAEDADPRSLREEIRLFEHKRHKLNAAIQAANFTNTISLDGEEVPFAEARRELDEARARFRRLNRALREASANVSATERSPVLRDRNTRIQGGNEHPMQLRQSR